MSDQIPENLPRQGMDYGETEEVQDTHAAIYREKVEPRIGREPLSLWLIATYGLAVFFLVAPISVATLAILAVTDSITSAVRPGLQPRVAATLEPGRPPN